MIELIVIDYLSGVFADIPVYAEEPAKPPEKYLLMEKMGGSEVDFICTAQIQIQSYAGSMLEAAKLNEEVKKAMREIITLDDVCSCGCNSDYNFTDTATKRYRYQALFNIVYYETE